MSNYSKITRHPRMGKYQIAMWHDDYFALHYYGVAFPDDTVVYPADLVEKAQLVSLYADDVIEGLRSYFSSLNYTGEGDRQTVEALEYIDKAFKERNKK